MNRVETLDGKVIELFNRKQLEFVEKANREWGCKGGECPFWGQFINSHVIQSWVELYRRN